MPQLDLLGEFLKDLLMPGYVNQRIEELKRRLAKVSKKENTQAGRL